MKNLHAIFLILAVISLASCGNGNHHPAQSPAQTLTSNFAFIRVDSGGEMSPHHFNRGTRFNDHLGKPQVSGNDSVVLMKNDGTDATVLVSGIGPVGSVQLSLDGKKGVSSEPDENGYMQIYYVDLSNLQSLHPVQLTRSQEDHVMPQFSPDGSKVIYHKWVSDILSQAFTVSVSGGSETQISTPGTSVLFPAYTPEGRQIVFTTPDQNYSYLRISIMNADGTGIHTITDVAGDLDEMPSVSSDGQTIVFSRYSDTGSGWREDIYSISLDGTNLKQLTTDAMSWDPQYVNDKIVFISYRDKNGGGEIYSMGLDGSNQKNLTNDVLDEYFFWD
jgi:Tol biopolymer transport system component